MGGGTAPQPAQPVPLLPGMVRPSVMRAQEEDVPAPEDVPPSRPGPPKMRGISEKQKFQMRKLMEELPGPEVRDPNPLALPLGGIAGERGAPAPQPGTAGYDELQDTLKDLGIARPETRAEAATAVANELAGRNRSRYEIMTDMPAGGGVMQESKQRWPMSSLPPTSTAAQLASLPRGVVGAIQNAVVGSQVLPGQGEEARAAFDELVRRSYATPPVVDPGALRSIEPRQTAAWLDDPYQTGMGGNPLYYSGPLRSRARMRNAR